MAFSGAGCVSTMRPSAPMATPARATGGTRLRFPVAWLGSRITGKCVSSFRTGIAEMSQVLRVAVSNVRMPRSHRITSGLPCAVMYSALIRSSLMLLLRPRFSSTGLPHVSVSRHKLHLVVAHDFGDDREARGSLRLLQQLQAIFFHALKIIR